jgi:hypothetical protein
MPVTESSEDEAAPASDPKGGAPMTASLPHSYQLNLPLYIFVICNWKQQKRGSSPLEEGKSLDEEYDLGDSQD